MALGHHPGSQIANQHFHTKVKFLTELIKKRKKKRIRKAVPVEINSEMHFKLGVSHQVSQFRWDFN